MRLPLLRLATAVSLSVAGLAAMPVTAGAHDPAQQPAKVVRMQDDCDPQTFNAVLGAGACVGEGDTTFEELVTQLTERGGAGAWRFSPERLTLRHGARLRAVNQGGEVHSFTKVRRFGPGCVAEVNHLLGYPAGAMVRECRSPAWLRTLRGSGGTVRVGTLEPGTHRFECLIHPWMRTTVHVRDAHH